MSDKKFANGLIVKERRPTAPEYVICNLSIKVDEFIQTLQENQSNGWVNINCLIAKSGKPYAEIDTWQPTQGDAAKVGMQEVKATISNARSVNSAINGPDGFADLEDIPF